MSNVLLIVDKLLQLTRNASIKNRRESIKDSSKENADIKADGENKSKDSNDEEESNRPKVSKFKSMGTRIQIRNSLTAGLAAGGKASVVSDIKKKRMMQLH